MTKTCLSKEQFASLLQTKKQKLYRMAFCYVKNEQDALDIVGEAVYKGLQSLTTLREPEYFDTWMTRIVINTAIDFLRKNSRCSVCEDAILELMPVEENSLDPESSLDLYTALDALGQRDKTCVILKYFEGYTFQEIAGLLNEPEATVKSRLYRSLAKMRTQLEKGGKAQ